MLTESPAAPTVVAARTKRSIIDCGSNLLSRQLEREHGRMLGRAQYEHVDACISFVTDAERLDELAALARAQPGFVYMAAGVHPDNIKRSHDKSSTSLLAKVRSLALTPECVAIYAGLDGTRDFASQFPQEKLLKEVRGDADIHAHSPADSVSNVAPAHLVNSLLLSLSSFSHSSLAATGAGSGDAPARPADGH